MPELPEVETICRQLKVVLKNKKIKNLKIYDQRHVKLNPSQVVGFEIKDVRRRAKIVIIELNNQTSLVIHLKMTGQLIYQTNDAVIRGGHPTADWFQKMPIKSTRFELSFNDGSKLYFNDQRGFGWLEQMKNSELEVKLERFSKIDPLSPQFTPEYLAKVCSLSRRPIKVVLMDQKLIGGIGNIYANDGLWLAKIHPLRPANGLSEEEIKKLHQAIIEVIKEGLKFNGTTISNYRDANGQSGRYQQHFKVYSRAGQKCLRNDGGVIKVIKVAGRRTFFCPVCQK